MANKSVLELGGRTYNADWLRSVPEAQAVNRLRGHCDPSQVRNAWKQANGKTVRNYSKPPEPVEKPAMEEKKKRTRKPKSESNE